MLKYFSILLILFSSNVFSNESLLTIQQQIERLQREVSDLSQAVFSNTDLKSSNNSDLVTNLSAIDMRIYDIEKDVKNLTGSLEDIYFQIEDLTLQISNFENIIKNIETSLLEIRSTSKTVNNENIISKNKPSDENTLGSLKITSEDQVLENNLIEETISEEKEIVNLSPEDQFQSAFDNIRGQNWNEAKLQFEDFIENFPNNQLSGSAYYWLGELYILEKKFRDSALVFAEGYQKFPQSIKAPDMLYKLSTSLYEVNKINESCKTLQKLIFDFPKNKFIKNAKKQLQDYGCLENNE